MPEPPRAPEKNTGPEARGARLARAALGRSAGVFAAALAAVVSGVLVIERASPALARTLLRLAAVWGYSALLALACAVLGLFVLERGLRVRGLPALEAAVSGAGIGVVGFALCTFAAGFLHAFGAAFAVLTPLLFLAAGARHAIERLRRFRRERAPTSSLGAAAAAARVFGVVGILAVYLGALTPDSINFDASWFHLALAADYARKGGIVAFPGDYMRSVPHLASLLYTWAFLVPGLSEQLRWMLAQHIEIWLFGGTLVGIAAMARFLLDRPGAPPARSTWAAMFLFPAIFVYDSNLGCAADHVLAFFAAPLFLAAVRAAGSLDPAESALAGILAGGALLTKYQGVYPIAGVVVAAAAVRIGGVEWWSMVPREVESDGGKERAHAPVPGGRREEAALVTHRRRAWITAAIAAAVTFALILPQWLMSWAFHRNPVYPFAQDLFPRSTPALPGGAFLVEHLWKPWTARPTGTLLERLGSSLRMVVAYSFETHYSFTGERPTAGSLFTLGLFVLPFLRLTRREGRFRRGEGATAAPEKKAAMEGDGRRLWLGAAAGCAALFVWAFTLRIDRNVQTFLPLLVATTAAVLVRAWEMGRWVRAGATLLVACQIAAGVGPAAASSRERFRSAFALLGARGGSAGDSGAPGELDYRRDFRAVSRALPEGSVVLMHDHRSCLGINHDVVFDLPGQQGLVRYDEVADPRGLHALLRGLGVTHVVQRPGLRPAATRQTEVLFADYAARFAASRRTFGALELLDLAAAPPPAETPYLVLAVGLEGYEDGLYPVESMSTIEHLPPELRRYPAPMEHVAPRAETLAAAADRASAALLGPGAHLGPAAREALDRAMVTALRYDDLTVSLRRRATP